MSQPLLLLRSAPTRLAHGTVVTAIACREHAIRHRTPEADVWRAVQSTSLAAHIALPQSMIDEAVGWVMAWRAPGLSSPPSGLQATGGPGGRIAAQLIARGIPVGVLAGVGAPLPTLVAAAG